MIEENKRKKLVRDMMEALGFSITDEVRDMFNGKSFIVVDDDEYERLYSGKPVTINLKSDFKMKGIRQN